MASKMRIDIKGAGLSKRLYLRHKILETLVVCCLTLVALSTNAIAYVQTGVIVETLGTGVGSINSYSNFFDTNVNCTTGSTQGCFGQFLTGENISFYATPDSKSTFSGWGGICVGQLVNPCSVNIKESLVETYLSAAFNFKPMFMTGSTTYVTMKSAFDAASDGAYVYGVDNTFTEEVVLNRPVTIIFFGGKSDDFNSTIGSTMIKGSLTILSGTFKASNLVIRVKNSPQ
jgi:Divergent InlB B-repeat domain